MESLVPAIFGIIGVLIGGSLSYFNNRRERRQRLLHEQLQEFYGPLLAIRSRIRARSQLALKLSQIAGDQWPKLVSDARPRGPEAVKRVEADRFPEFQRLIEYDNKQLRSETLPAYRQMIEIFTSKMHLAEPSTREHLPELISFVEVWDRWTDQSLPREVLMKLDHSEQKLQPFYDELELQFGRLQRQVKERRYS